MEVDYRLLKPETLRALAEDFVLREGTDYGVREATHQTKIDQVVRLIEIGKARVVYDPETQSCDIRESNPVT